MAQQPCRELPPSLSTTGACHAPLPPDAIAPEIRRRTFLHPKPVQRAAPVPSRDTSKDSRTADVAKWRDLCSLTPSGFDRTGTGSHCSDTAGKDLANVVVADAEQREQSFVEGAVHGTEEQAAIGTLPST
jgi:hypothetical protein